MKVKKHINNFNWSLESEDNIGKHILGGNLWEPHLMKFISQFVKPGDFCIDIGACFGWHTLHMAQCVGEKGLVYAFEPLKENLELLKENISNNNFENITVHEVALGNKNIYTCMYSSKVCNSKNSGDAFVSTSFGKNFESDLKDESFIYKCGDKLRIDKDPVECKTLDSIDLQRPIKFIKLDVQGFERMVIEGSENLIQKDRPVIAVELEDPCMVHYGYSSKELIQYIQSLDYYIYFLDFSYPCDHICVPNEKLEDFEVQFQGKIHDHCENNWINNNFNNGIVKKIGM